MSSKREQVMALALEILQTVNAGGITTDNVSRTRNVRFKDEDLPAINLVQGQCPCKEGMAGLDWTLRIHVETYIGADIPDEAADPIVDDIHKKLVAVDSFQSLGFVMDVSPLGFTPDSEFGFDNYIKFVQLFDINFRTAKGET